MQQIWLCICNIFIMNNTRTWVDVVHEVQQSGLNIQRQRAMQEHERFMNVQKQLQNQINLSLSRKAQQNKLKSLERIKAERIDRNHYEKQRAFKRDYRQKQSKFRVQNLELIKHRNQFDKKLFQEEKLFKNIQNPITANLCKNNDSRKSKSKYENIMCENINQKLLDYRLKTQKQIKEINSLQGRKFQNHVEQTFKRIDEQRNKFKKFCLEAGSPQISKLTDRSDSLQREYSSYLKKQIDEKKSRNNNSIFKGDEITDKNLLKLNQYNQIQSASPAYLGRIPYNSDRKKQILYLNRQANRHNRTKTQGSQYSLPIIKLNMQVQNEPKLQTYSTNPQIITYKPPELKSQKIKQVQQKQARKFLQYNIITNNLANVSVPSHL